MKKLNGNIYLKVEEVEKEIDSVRDRFRTSHRAVLPKCIRYLDVKCVEIIHDESRNLCASMNYLYGYGEEYTSLKLVVHKIQERFRDPDSVEDTLQFMQYDLSEKQRKKYRQLYQNFIVNVFLEECIKRLKKMS